MRAFWIPVKARNSIMRGRTTKVQPRKSVFREGALNKKRPAEWCGSKGAYDRPSYPCHYCTHRGGLLRQGVVDKAKADDQGHAGERQHHQLQVRKAVGGKQRKIVHDTLPTETILA